MKNQRRSVREKEKEKKKGVGQELKSQGYLLEKGNPRRQHSSIKSLPTLSAPSPVPPHRSNTHSSNRESLQSRSAEGHK